MVGGYIYGVRLLCLCEIVSLKSYLGGQTSRSSRSSI